MKKVITFCLWGDNPNYNIGAIKNAELATHFYPDFECWFYIHESTVPKDTILNLNKLNNVKIIYKDGDLNTCKPMMWRFEAIDEPDVEVMLSRDTDTRILFREKMAVEAWLKSNKLFHIMRDHPYHKSKIMGGMFGTKKIPEIINWTKIMKTFTQVGIYDYDQQFLNKYVYPLIINDVLIHASFNKYESNCINFPIFYIKQLRFVGEYIYSDESRDNQSVNDLYLHLCKNKMLKK
jgi:hypothetical protein